MAPNPISQVTWNGEKRGWAKFILTTFTAAIVMGVAKPTSSMPDTPLDLPPLCRDPFLVPYWNTSD